MGPVQRMREFNDPASCSQHLAGQLLPDLAFRHQIAHLVLLLMPLPHHWRSRDQIRAH